MVTYQEHSRFYSRNSKGKYPLDVGEIRSAFALSESLSQRVRQFRSERLAMIVADEPPVRMIESAKFVVHILPVAALDVSTSIDLKDAYARLPLMKPIPNRTFDSRYNLDGIVTYAASSEGPSESYVQLFRSGAIEAVEAHILEESAGRRVIRHVQIEKGLIEGVKDYVALLLQLGAEPPFFALISFLGVKGYSMIPPDGFDMRWRRPIDRDTLVLPYILLIHEGVPDVADVATALRPAFDALWQAADWPRCQNYTDRGEWRGEYASYV
jgi:hypothetical protein